MQTESSELEPTRLCPICQVAMQTIKTQNGNLMFRCDRCGTIITVAKPSIPPE